MPEPWPQVLLRLVQEPQTRLVQKGLPLVLVQLRRRLALVRLLAQHFRQEVQPQKLSVLMMLQALGASAVPPPARQAQLATPTAR
jgi:hypothetical protein